MVNVCAPSAFDHRLALIPGVIAQHGKWQSRKPAIVCGARSTSWGELDAATNRVANGLLAAGCRPGDRLAVLMHGSAEMAEIMFGAMKAGICVVPLNLSVSDAAVVAMIADCRPTALAASDEQCARVDALPVAGVKLKIGVRAPNRNWQQYGSWLADHAPAAPGYAVAPDDHCNIIYSSGTTSLPKGIVHTHRCRYDTAFDLGLALRYHTGAVVLSSLGLYSNISWVALLCTALCGATLVLMPQFSAASLADQIERQRVTHAVFVPLQLQRLLDLEGVRKRDFSSLQTIMVCGSPMGAALKDAVRRLLGCEVIELYGLTEGLVTTLAPEDFDRKLASVGKPLPGIELKLIDDADREVAAGEPGEICGTSRFLMAGYFNRPEATAEATWINSDGARWLRTGDIGRLDEDGFLYIVDRKKDMILSGGQNIYPADIEAIISQRDDVDEVAVIGMKSEQWGETPLAVVVPKAGVELDPQALATWTNERVGRQQRVSNVVLRAALPRNPNGKILKRELRDEYGTK
jgi:acyl-CoA synthetase (AMP-forming)/AMP-acid ligase II